MISVCFTHNSDMSEKNINDGSAENALATALDTESPGKNSHELVITLNRIKTFIKEDAEVKSISTEACFAVAKATELLLELITQKAAKQVLEQQLPEMPYSSIANTVASWEALDFLQDHSCADVVPKKIPAALVLEKMKQTTDIDK